ncbi:hypothetical protein CLU81_0493 [Flavobacterium sp. 9]|nr:hypothetical protein CLU81_0493 [Flavobacterium sp. 9]
MLEMYKKSSYRKSTQILMEEQEERNFGNYFISIVIDDYKQRRLCFSV